MVDYENISVERHGALAVITIKREKALNALNTTVLSELVDATAAVEVDPEVAVVALTGAGKAFVAGADISEMKDMSPQDALGLAELGASVGGAIETSDKPYIAAVNGFALGGGCELALACDFIYASEKARFGQPEVKLGVIPGFGGTQRLARRVGVAKAKQLCFTGEMIGAAEALSIGLADLVVAPEQLMDKVRETADAIAANGPLAVAECKRLIHVGQSMSLDDAILLEQRTFMGLFSTEDKVEGMSAFLEKRNAEFQGN